MSVLHEVSGRSYADSIVERFFDCKENKLYWKRLAREQEEEMQQLQKEHDELADILMKSKYTSDVGEEGQRQEQGEGWKVVEQRGEDQEPLGETFDLMIETKFREMFAELQGKLHRAKLAKKEMKKQLHNRGKQINNAQYGISMLLGQASVLENDDRLMRMYDDYQYMKSREENQKVFKETLNKKLSKGEGTSSSGIGEILSKLQRVESFEQDEERGVKESLRSLNRSRDLLITALKVIKETSLIRNLSFVDDDANAMFLSAEDMKKPELSFDLDVENFEDSTQDTPLESNTTR
eukprot:766677-Hanusia_phi.AAC.2